MAKIITPYQETTGWQKNIEKGSFMVYRIFFFFFLNSGFMNEDIQKKIGHSCG